MQEFKSILKKGVTIVKDGLEPYQVGKNNFELVNIEVEELAKKRADVCSGCRYFKKEPIPSLAVTDKKIPVLSEMMCGRCGCTLSYKTRQSIKMCAKWLNG